jgi:hypothetical protein
MTENQPHAKYPHVFGVLRIDSYEDMELDDRLMLTSVFTTSEAARTTPCGSTRWRSREAAATDTSRFSAA